MLFSTVYAKNTLEKNHNTREGYDDEVKCDPFTVLSLAVIVIIELLFLILALYMAISLTTGSVERLIHVLLALFVPLPYLLIMSTLNERGVRFLENSNPMQTSDKYCSLC